MSLPAAETTLPTSLTLRSSSYRFQPTCRSVGAKPSQILPDALLGLKGKAMKELTASALYQGSGNRTGTCPLDLMKSCGAPLDHRLTLEWHRDSSRETPLTSTLDRTALRARRPDADISGPTSP